MNKEYINFIEKLKEQINFSRYAAARLVNKEQLLLYFNIGKAISDKVQAEKWGDGVVSQMAEDLNKQVPGLKGFSYRNIRNMRQFYDCYPKILELDNTPSIWQPLAAKLRFPIENQPVDLFFGIGFTHHILIMNRCETAIERWFYILKASTELWSKRTLEYQIDSGLFRQMGTSANNFHKALPAEINDKASLMFKDNYLFDFIKSSDEDSERVFEGKLVSNIRDTIMSLGKGFCFMGNQYRVEVDGDDFFIDLLFYNRELNCLVAFELKSGKFKPEYAGQLNFYLNVLDDSVRKAHENASIGVILCKEKSNTVVEYALRNINNGMAAATYRTSKELPEDVKGFLPDAEALSKMLSE